ncbi:MAG: hypothetical protein J5I91_05480 [Bacteroidetes bacterium]|nr:hypothetical protein [Bacteroidota bacterium]
MRLLLLASFIFLNFGFSPRQSGDEFVEVGRVSVNNLEHFTCDNMGNIYTVGSNGDIIKFDKDGKQVAVANHKSLGNVHSIDASNPFEIYVFYKDQNKVLYFDNQLNTLGVSNLEDGGFVLLSACARSFDSKIWAFDLSDLKLKKIKRDMTVELSSGNVREYSSGQNFAPFYIADVNKSVYLFDSTSGLFEFDNFGNYKRNITLTDAKQFFVMSGNLFFLKNNAVYQLDNEFLREKMILVKDGPVSISAFSISPDRLVLQSGNELILYAQK